MGLGIFCIDRLNCWLTAWSGVFGVWQEGRICGDCSKYKFFRCDGRRGTFSFSRKIYKLALALVSGKWSKVFQFTQFTMGCECHSKLQICSSERECPPSSVASKKLIFKTIPANPSLLPNPKDSQTMPLTSHFIVHKKFRIEIQVKFNFSMVL